MNNLKNKFTKVEKEISQEKGEFSLFVLLLREDSQDKWDVVLSASWFPESKKEVLTYIVNKLVKILTPKELLKLSRIVALNEDDSFVANLNSVINTKHNAVEFKNCQLNNIHVKHAYVITSRKVSETKNNKVKTIRKSDKPQPKISSCNHDKAVIREK